MMTWLGREPGWQRRGGSTRKGQQEGKERRGRGSSISSAQSSTLSRRVLRGPLRAEREDARDRRRNKGVEVLSEQRKKNEDSDFNIGAGCPTRDGLPVRAGNRPAVAAQWWRVSVCVLQSLLVCVCGCVCVDVDSRCGCPCGSVYMCISVFV